MHRPKLATVARIAVAYLVAAVVANAVYCGRDNGHADVPFTTLPECLFVSPLVPPLLVAGALSPVRLVDGARRECALGVAVFAASFAAAWLAARALAARRVRPRGAGARSA